MTSARSGAGGATRSGDHRIATAKFACGDATIRCAEPTGSVTRSVKAASRVFVASDVSTKSGSRRSGGSAHYAGAGPAAFRSRQTALTSAAEVNGFATRTLLGTPIE